MSGVNEASHPELHGLSLAFWQAFKKPANGGFLARVAAKVSGTMSSALY